MRTRSLTGLFGVLAAVGVLIGACGDDGGDSTVAVGTEPTQGPSDSGGVSNSSIVPNTFLTFDGNRYRLEGLEQANLSASDGEYHEVGTASEADIDQTDLTVYRRAGDTAVVYTYAAAEGEGEEATPAFWYRWVLEA